MLIRGFRHTVIGNHGRAVVSRSAGVFQAGRRPGGLGRRRILLGACSDTSSAAALGDGGGQTPLQNIKPKVVSTDEPLNRFEDITSYNNFYEFGTGKNDPQRCSDRSRRRPGPSRSTASAASLRHAHLEDRSRTSSSRSAFTGCAASKPGRW